MIGSTISHYRVLDELGRGGMGVVYRALDTRLGREVALKFLPDDVARDGPGLARFRREARSASALNHPSICTIYDVGEHEGRHFIAMELLRGESLTDRLASGPLAMEELKKLGAQLADALETAHAHGIVHRDVKPGNIFITARGDAKLLDFGLAKPTPAGDQSVSAMTLEAELTQGHRVVGTPNYMSPEQALGRPLDGRSDLFSLGVVLYVMATGRKPFEAGSLPAILDAVLHRDPAPVTTINEKAPAALDQVIARCLAKDPDVRYRAARELREDLERIAPSGPAGARPRSPRRRWWLRSPRSPRRRTAVALIAGVVAAAIVAVAVVSLRQREVGARPHAASPLLAVLPFSNQTGELDRRHLGEALSAGLLADLAQITGLRLVAPISVGGASAEDAGVEARRLGAQLLLGGEVQDELGRLRVNARIVEASSGMVMWTHVTRAEALELFHVQREITRGVTDFLSIPMSPAERRRLAQEGPSSLEASARYVEGRRQLMTADGAERAVDLFAQAVAGDPDFALAYAALGEAQWTVYERTKDRQRLRAAQEAVARARALDRDLPQTILVAMLVDASSGRLETGEQLERALSQHPRPAEASRLLAASYELAGDLEHAERLLRSATALDPQDWFNWSWLGAFLLLHRGADQAREALERADRLAPAEVWQPRAYLGVVALQQGRFEDAIGLLEDLPAPITDAAAASNLAMAYYYSERRDKWERAEQHFRAALELSPERAEYHGNLADLHAERGRTAEAIVGYRRAMDLSRVETEANPGDLEAHLRVALYAAKAEECPSALAVVREAWMDRPEREARMERPESSGELHEIALVFALCRERDEALAALAAAVERGFSAELLGAEAELEWLRQDPLFPRPRAAEPPRGGGQ